MRAIPRKYKERVVFYRRVYARGTPLDCVEDLLLLDNFERLAYTQELKEWLDKMEGWVMHWTGENNR